MNSKIIIIGGKGSAVVVAEQLYDAQLKGENLEFIGFAFDDELMGTDINGFPIICKTKEVKSYAEKYSDVKVIYQLYRPDLIKERINLLKSYSIPKSKFYTFVHPSVIVSKSASFGVGSCILANSVINPNVKIGNFNTIHSNSLVGHDTTINDYNFIAAHTVVGSNNSIGTGNFFGLNSTFNNYLSIGDYCFVGMGSNVIKNIKSNMKVVGNPAKPFFNKIKEL